MSLSLNGRLEVSMRNNNFTSYNYDKDDFITLGRDLRAYCESIGKIYDDYLKDIQSYIMKNREATANDVCTKALQIIG